MGKPCQPVTTVVDFRDFMPGVLSQHQIVEKYDGLLGSFDCIIAADIVYESSEQGGHATLSRVVDAMMKPGCDACALFLLPDSRPGLQLFADRSRQDMDVACAK